MKAEELRIGNYVEYNGMSLSVIGIDHPTPRKPDRYDGKWIVSLLCNGIITAIIDEVTPILLADEWLVKFGFTSRKLTASSIEYSLNDFLIISENGSEFWRVLKSDGGIYEHMYDVEVKYIHQLQNLYFAIEQKELILNS